jgi:dihydroflavonol-4-reductase
MFNANRKKMNNNLVLLTGISGFIGSHTAIKLLDKGYEVIGTLRDISREEEIRKMLSKHTSNLDNLKIVEADLLDEQKWMDLSQGVDYIMHVASPFPRKLPKNDDEIVVPAVNGTLNILKAASANKVKRVVITSSSTAITYGKSKAERNSTFNEMHWTDPENRKDTTPYFRSKTIAEKSAWDFVNKDKSGLELTTICPGAVLGPVLEKDFGTSANIVLKTMDGSTPAIPKIGFEVVDVRSLAEMHVLAIESKQAAGERFIAAAGFMSFKNVADILRKAYPDRKIPKAPLPNLATRFISNFETTLKPILLDLNVERRLDSSKARELLNWQPISNEEAVIACAESLIEQELL